MGLLEEISISKFPKILKIEQLFNHSKIKCISNEIKQQIIKSNLQKIIFPGAKVAIAVGSREIANVDEIVFQIINNLKSFGVNPFIIPAMGSHGGASEKGQLEVLAEYNISPKNMGVPMMPSMDVIKLGCTDKGLPIYFSSVALKTDVIIVINKIKLHTNFRGKIESGILKMLVVGLGKHMGALEIHKYGFENFGSNLIQFGKEIIKKAPTVFGLAIIENAYREITRIKLIPKENILIEEPKLLSEAKSLIAKIPFKAIDLLIVQEIGKNISGDGMDPNVTGRFSSELKPDPSVPKITRIVVLDLSKKTRGNAVGIGYADLTTKKLVKKIDYTATYTNAITTTAPGVCKIPITMENDRYAIEAALKTCGNIDYQKTKIVIIKNTLNLNEMFISESLISEALENKNIRITGEIESLKFDIDKNLKLSF